MTLEDYALTKIEQMNEIYFSPHMNVFGVLTRIYLETTTASYPSLTQILNAGEQLAITP